MSKRSEILFEAIGEVRDDLLDEAACPENLKQKTPWMRYGAIAAALVLAVGIGARVIPRAGMGGAEAPGVSASGSGSDGASEFMSYAGPAFPLTLMEENPAVTAERTLTLDFLPWEPNWISNEMQLEEARGYGATEEELAAHAEDLKRWYPEGGYYDKGTDLLVKDEYVLTNSTDEEQIVEILYPFVGSLGTYKERMPELLVDGEEQMPECLFGDYAGGFRGAFGGGGTSINLNPPDSWEDYQRILSDGSYLMEATEEAPDLTQIPAVLYTFTEPWGPERSKGVPNPSIRVGFDMDYETTRILSYGFHSGSSDVENGWMGKGFSIPQPFRDSYGRPYYLIAVGEDISNMTTDCYVSGGWDDDAKVDGGVNVERTETTLDGALRLAAAELVNEGYIGKDDFELQYAQLRKYLMTYGALAEDPVERYMWGMLENLESASVDRVIYLKQSVTIPANGSVTVTVCAPKEASFDFACTGSDNVGVCGYDAVTTLGSNLDFAVQTARLEYRGQIDIVRQNFGFDLEQGVREVELDPETEHYYLEVRRVGDR